MSLPPPNGSSMPASRAASNQPQPQTHPHWLQLQLQLQAWFEEAESCVVAYSGGVDSALLAVVGHQVLGIRSLAVIGVSPSLPRSEYSDALALARSKGFPVIAQPTDELSREGYVANDGHRCYHCRLELYGLLAEVASSRGLRWMVDGYHRDDAGDDRPGRRAATEHAVRSPLWELGWGKQEVRDLARFLELPVWSKPASACLSSRLPQGTRVTTARLAMVEEAEAFLRSLGFIHCRVRHHEPMARIEVLLDDLPKLLAGSVREQIVRKLRSIGYHHVTLDLEGYRPGGRPAPSTTSDES